MPFDIAFLVLESAIADLEDPHCHPWSNLGQLDAVISGPDKNMVPDLNAILDVLECYHSVADLVLGCNSFARRENVLQDLHHPLTQATGKAVENEVGIRLAHGSSDASRNIVTEHNIM
ncbi:hypothetical protein HG530_006303 [Fusarium avenaceum]|nr:hypothetical protein HG530_006303 [Fusarium avenaceum]